MNENSDPFPFKQLESYSYRRPKRWHRPRGGVWPFAISAATGASSAFAVSAIVDWAATTSEQECANATEMCWGSAPYVGLAGSFFVVSVLCWTGFALAGLKPVLAYVPLAIVVFLLMTILFAGEVHGGRLHPAAGFAGLMAFVFLLFPALDRQSNKPRP